jgi:H+/Cl- antiporter ClcA
MSIRSKPFYKLILVSALVGGLAGLQFLLFITIMTYGQEAIWEGIASSFGLAYGAASTSFIIGFCALGGLLVGLITKLTKVPPHLLVQDMQEYGETGEMDPRGGWVGMIRGLVGLLFGGSIGPEGPLTGGSGALGTYFAKKAKLSKPVEAVTTYAAMNGMFGAFLGSPFIFPLITVEGSGKLNWKLVLPGIVAGSVGFGVFDIITNKLYGPIYQFPPYSGFQFVQLFEAVLLGLVGGLLGLLFIRFYRALKTAIRPWESHPIELAVTAGLILGAVASAFPLVLFDGQNQINVLLLHTAEYSILFLLVLALAKLFVTVICLAFGWSGGYIFPSLMIGTSLGLAMHLLLPFIPEIVCLCCAMTGVAVVLLRSPIAISILVIGLFGLHIVPIVMISATTAFLLGVGETLLIAPTAKVVVTPLASGGSVPRTGGSTPPNPPTETPAAE